MKPREHLLEALENGPMTSTQAIEAAWPGPKPVDPRRAIGLLANDLQRKGLITITRVGGPKPAVYSLKRTRRRRAA